MKQLAGTTVLLIEPELHFRHVVSRILVRAGGTVEHAANGWEGLQALSHRGPPMIDIVLTEWSPGGLSASDLLRRIRRVGGDHSRTPVVVITGEAEMAVVKAAMAAGVNGFLGKPLSPEALVGQLARLTEEPPQWEERGKFVFPRRTSAKRKARDLPGWQQPGVIIAERAKEEGVG